MTLSIRGSFISLCSAAAAFFLIGGIMANQEAPMESSGSTERPAEVLAVKNLPVLSSDTVVPGRIMYRAPQEYSRIAEINAAGALVYSAPGGTAAANLQPGEKLPVLEEQAGHVLVPLPGRVGLPSSGAEINGGSGWVRITEVELRPMEHFAGIDLREGRLLAWGSDNTSNPVSNQLVKTSMLPMGVSFVDEISEKEIVLGIHSGAADSWGGDNGNQVRILPKPEEPIALPPSEGLNFGDELPHSAMLVATEDFRALTETLEEGTTFFLGTLNSPTEKNPPPARA